MMTQNILIHLDIEATCLNPFEAIAWQVGMLYVNHDRLDQILGEDSWLQGVPINKWDTDTFNWTMLSNSSPEVQNGQHLFPEGGEWILAEHVKALHSWLMACYQNVLTTLGVGDKNIYVMCAHPEYDIIILKRMFNMVGLSLPFFYRNILDNNSYILGLCRGNIAVASAIYATYKRVVGGVAHSAVEDCKRQHTILELASLFGDVATPAQAVEESERWLRHYLGV